MKMETSKALSKLMIGENQLSAKNLGYEMTKNVLTILSPRLSSRGETLRADGAMMSLRSRAAESYSSCGKAVRIGASVFLPKMLLKIPMLLIYLDRLFRLARMKQFVVQRNQ